MSKKILGILILFISVSCGGGGSALSSESNATSPEIKGLQADLNAIEPVDLD